MVNHNCRRDCGCRGEFTGTSVGTYSTFILISPNSLLKAQR